MYESRSKNAIEAAARRVSGYGFFRKNASKIIMLALVIVLISVFTPQFFNTHNLTIVARQTAMGITALGMAFVVLAGGIDMSVGSVTAMCGIIFASLLRDGAPAGAALAAALLTGALVGAVNAFGILFCGIQSFIMTISTSSVCLGAAYVICSGIPVGISGVSSGVVDFLGIGSVGGVPTVFLLFILLAIAFQVALKYLPFGRYIYSVGSSMVGARLAGIRTSRVCLTAYIICSVCAALVGVIGVCTYKAGYLELGTNSTLTAIAAIVIGGVSLNGGKGSVMGAVAGAILLTATSNILGLMGINAYVQKIAEGVIIICAILLSAKDLKQTVKNAWRQM